MAKGWRRVCDRVGHLAAVAVLLCSCGGAQPAVDVEIASPLDGAVVAAGEPVALTVQLQGGALIADDHSEGGEHDAGSEADGQLGHLHIFVDDQIVAMPSELRPEVTLPPGDHTVTVEFVDEDHLSLEPPVTDRIMIEAG